MGVPVCYGSISYWAILFSGFGQRVGLSGVDSIYRDCRRKASATSEVLLQYWSDDPEALADRIVRHSPTSGPEGIVIAGYSWGGQTAINLCESLRDRGLKVTELVLCDPVARSPLWFRWWRALLPNRTIRVPGNVTRVWSCYQRANLPQGHRVIGEPGQDVIERELFGVRHEHMDDRYKFREVVLEAIGGIL